MKGRIAGNARRTYGRRVLICTVLTLAPSHVRAELAFTALASGLFSGHLSRGASEVEFNEVAPLNGRRTIALALAPHGHLAAVQLDSSGRRFLIFIDPATGQTAPVASVPEEKHVTGIDYDTGGTLWMAVVVSEPSSSSHIEICEFDPSSGSFVGGPTVSGWIAGLTFWRGAAYTMVEEPATAPSYLGTWTLATVDLKTGNLERITDVPALKDTIHGGWRVKAPFVHK